MTELGRPFRGTICSYLDIFQRGGGFQPESKLFEALWVVNPNPKLVRYFFLLNLEITNCAFLPFLVLKKVSHKRPRKQGGGWSRQF